MNNYLAFNLNQSIADSFNIVIIKSDIIQISSILLLQQLYLNFADILFLFIWRTDFVTLLRALFGTLLGTLFGQLWVRRRLFFWSICIIKFISFFLLILNLFYAVYSRCSRKLLADPVRLLLFFKQIWRIYLYFCFAVQPFQLKIIQTIDRVYLSNFIAVQINKSLHNC